MTQPQWITSVNLRRRALQSVKIQNGRAEPKVVDMEITQTFGEVRKTNRINKY